MVIYKNYLHSLKGLVTQITRELKKRTIYYVIYITVINVV